MGCPVVHFEIGAKNGEKLAGFYGKLFDWKLEDTPMPGGGSYTMINVGTGTGGGMLTSPTPGVPPHWLAYVGVEDVRAATQKAKQLGAKVVQDVMEVGEYGTMSVITDPTGATLAMWQPKSPHK